MRALVLDGSGPQDGDLAEARGAVAEELVERGYRVECLSLRAMKIAPCTGCFGCWIKTPGRCIVPDEARAIPGKILASDLLVSFTPVTFGGYSYELKKALDRSVCSLLLPFFTSIDGEMHHPPRYRRYPQMVGLGVLRQPNPDSEQLFTTLVGRNAINLHFPRHAAGVVILSEGPEAMRGRIHRLVAAAEGPR